MEGNRGSASTVTALAYCVRLQLPFFLSFLLQVVGGFVGGKESCN